MAAAPPKVIVKLVIQIHIFLYRLSGGKILNELANLPVLLLTTTGRKSGQFRTIPLVYHREGDDYIIVASYGGYDSHPAWYYNLKASPEVGLEIGGQAFTAQAMIVKGEERDRLYERFKTSSDNFVKYEARAPRIIPVVRLIPA